MSTVMSNFNFKMMTFFMKSFKKKSFIQQRIEESRIKEGDNVLDYACGPGIFTFPIAAVVGKTGKVFAADIHPLAGQNIRNKAKQLPLANVEFYQTEYQLPIPNDHIHVAVLFDCIHMFKNTPSILAEIHRVLRSDGLLSVDVHHIKKERVMQTIEDTGLFKIVENRPKVNHLLYAPWK